MHISPRLEKIKNRWELETLAWQWKVKNTYISIFLGHYRQPWKSHQPCTSDAFPKGTLPTILDITWLEYRFQGNAINLPCTYEDTPCGVTFLLPPPNSTSRHSQARGAIPAWNPISNFLAKSDDCMRLQKKIVQATQMTGAEYLSSPKTFHADSICVIRFLWTGWVLSCLNERQEFLDCFGNQSGELQMYTKRIPHNWLHSTQSNNEDQLIFNTYQGGPFWKGNWNLQTPWMLEGSVRELRILITYIPKPGNVSWSCQPFGSEKRERLPSIWPYTGIQQCWAPWHDNVELPLWPLVSPSLRFLPDFFWQTS